MNGSPRTSTHASSANKARAKAVDRKSELVLLQPFILFTHVLVTNSRMEVALFKCCWESNIMTSTAYEHKHDCCDDPTLRVKEFTFKTRNGPLHVHVVQKEKSTIIAPYYQRGASVFHTHVGDSEREISYPCLFAVDVHHEMRDKIEKKLLREGFRGSYNFTGEGRIEDKITKKSGEEIIKEVFTKAFGKLFT